MRQKLQPSTAVLILKLPFPLAASIVRPPSFLYLLITTFSVSSTLPYIRQHSASYFHLSIFTIPITLYDTFPSSCLPLLCPRSSWSHPACLKLPPSWLDFVTLVPEIPLRPPQGHPPSSSLRLSRPHRSMYTWELLVLDTPSALAPPALLLRLHLTALASLVCSSSSSGAPRTPPRSTPLPFP